MAKGRITVEDVLDPKVKEAFDELVAVMQQMKGLATDLGKTVNTLSTEVSELGKEEKKVAEVETASNKLRETASKKQGEYNALVARANYESAERKRILTLEGKANANYEGSIERLRAELGLLEHQWKRAGKAARESLTPELKKMRDEVKRLEAATGDHRRNVGNYKEAFSQLSGEVINSTGKLGQFAQMFSSGGPIVAGVAAIGAIMAAPFIAFFKLTENGVEMLERKIAGAKAAAGVLGGELARLGEAVVGKDSGPIKWGNVFSKVTKTLLSTANIIPGVGKYIDELGGKMNMSADAAEKFTRTMQELEEEESAAKVTRAKQNKEYADAMRLYRELEDGDIRKIETLQKVNELEEKQAKFEEVLNIKRRDALLTMYNLLKANNLTAQAEKILFQLNDAEAKVIDDNTKSTERQTSAIRKINTAKKDYNDILNKKLSLKKDQREADRLADIQREKERKAALRENDLTSAPVIGVSSIGKKMTQDEMDELALRELKVKTADIIKKNDAEIKENKKKDYEDLMALEREARDNIISGAMESAQILSNIANQTYDERINKLEQEKNKKIKLAGDNAAAVEKIEKEYAKKISVQKRKQALWDKATSLIQLSISTSMAIMKGFESGPIIGAINAILVGVTSAAQTALILSKEIPEVPAFFRGTRNAPGGVSMVGEKGQELVTTPGGKQFLTPGISTLLNLPAGSEVMPNDVLKTEMAGFANNRGYKPIKHDLQGEMLAALIQIRDNEQYDLGDYVVIKKGSIEKRIRKNK